MVPEGASTVNSSEPTVRNLKRLSNSPGDLAFLKRKDSPVQIPLGKSTPVHPPALGQRTRPLFFPPRVLSFNAAALSVCKLSAPPPLVSLPQLQSFLLNTSPVNANPPWFALLRETVSLLGHPFITRGRDPGTCRWKGCIEPRPSGSTTLPESPCSPAGSSQIFVPLGLSGGFIR